MTQEDIDNISAALRKLENTPSYDPMRMEVLMDTLASALSPLRTTKPETTDVVGILEVIPLSPQVKNKLIGLCEDIGEAVESRGYGDDDDDDNDSEVMSYLVGELCEILGQQLRIWEDEVAS